jgi:hypothetical protein
MSPSKALRLLDRTGGPDPNGVTIGEGWRRVIGHPTDESRCLRPISEFDASFTQIGPVELMGISGVVNLYAAHRR